jgi:hypothetical protein
LQLGSLLPTAHSALTAAFYLLNIVVVNGAMSKNGTSSQWRRELFTIILLVFSEDSGAMNASQYWQLRDDACSAVETSANTKAGQSYFVR